MENERRGREGGGEDIQNDKRHRSAHGNHHPFMLHRANILIPRRTARVPPALTRHENRRPVGRILVPRPIAIHAAAIPGAVVITLVVVRAIIEIIQRGHNGGPARGPEPEPEQQVAGDVGARVDGAVPREQGGDVGEVPEHGEPEGDVLPGQEAEVVVGEVVVVVVGV